MIFLGKTDRNPRSMTDDEVSNEMGPASCRSPDIRDPSNSSPSPSPSLPLSCLVAFLVWRIDRTGPAKGQGEGSARTSRSTETMDSTELVFPGSPVPLEYGNGGAGWFWFLFNQIFNLFSTLIFYYVRLACKSVRIRLWSLPRVRLSRSQGSRKGTEPGLGYNPPSLVEIDCIDRWRFAITTSKWTGRTKKHLRRTRHCERIKDIPVKAALVSR